MTDFPVAKNSYVAFDGLTIREKIRERLNQTGIFTDQNFEGSNLAGINDAISMSFSLLLYYLNQNSVNGQFSQTTIYENINKIVKELGYNPIGHQTASVNFTLTANGDMDIGVYTIPRYSSINVAGISYSLSQDISFTKTVEGNEEITGIEDLSTLYQGDYVEFPIVIPAGNVNETIVLTVGDSDIVDAFNIDVYVKYENIWTKWNRSQSLFLNSYSDKVYEIRFNENKRYEIKFGDDINGKKLLSSNEVAIYYTKSLGKSGEIGALSLVNKKINTFNTDRLTEILADVSSESYLSSADLSKMTINNKFSSTYYTEPESVDSIKSSAVGAFRSQLSLTTAKSFETFVRSNFSNIIHDVKVKNNSEYQDSYFKYFYDLGLMQPQFESRALFNQLRFSDACNFNNVYLFIVPKIIGDSLGYLAPSQKTAIVRSMNEEKVLTCDVIPVDPVYLLFDICLPEMSSINPEDIDNSELVVERSAGSKINESSIKKSIETLIVDFFKKENNTLGQSVNIQKLYTDILQLDGVGKLYTRNSATGISVEGLKMVSWNSVYFDRSIAEVGSIQLLQDFQFPHLNNKNFTDRITIQ